MKQKQGKITVPPGTRVLPHELMTATILSWTGDDVEFLPVRSTHYPDIVFRGRQWEMKAPKGSKRRTIENNIRHALEQSNNIIIDLARINIPENVCIKNISDRAKKLGKSKKFIIVTKSRKIIEL